MEPYLEEYSDYIKLYKVIIMRSRTLPSRGPLCEEMSYFVNASEAGGGGSQLISYLPTLPGLPTYRTSPPRFSAPWIWRFYAFLTENLAIYAPKNGRRWGCKGCAIFR